MPLFLCTYHPAGRGWGRTQLAAIAYPVEIPHRSAKSCPTRYDCHDHFSRSSQDQKVSGVDVQANGP